MPASCLWRGHCCGGVIAAALMQSLWNKSLFCSSRQCVWRKTSQTSFSWISVIAGAIAVSSTMSSTLPSSPLSLLEPSEPLLSFLVLSSPSSLTIQTRITIVIGCVLHTRWKASNWHLCVKLPRVHHHHYWTEFNQSPVLRFFYHPAFGISDNLMSSSP